METTRYAPVEEMLDEKALLIKIALENTSVELEQRIMDLGRLANIGRIFASSARLEEVAARGLEILLDSTPALRGSILICSSDGEGLCMLAAGAKDGRTSYFGMDSSPLMLFAYGEGLAGQSLAGKKPLVAPDVAAEPRFTPRPGKVKIGSAACIPMLVDDKPLGVVTLSHPDTGVLKPEGAGLWMLIAGYLAVALSNAMSLVNLRDTNERLRQEVESRTRSLMEANLNLKDAQEKIARNNEELKLKVEERSSELTRALKELQARTDSLESANKIKDEFLNNINHELKTPLNAIIGYSGLLLKEAGALTSEQYSDLEVIESNGRHLQQIIDNILALKEIEGGNVEPEYIRTDLFELLRMAANSVAPRARAKGLLIKLDDAGREIPPFTLDPTLIRRVVYNLLDNAIKFSSRGVIEVRAELRNAGGDEPPLAVVEVIDQGRGVGPGDAERIFQKFQQGEPAMRKIEGGSGVGLAIAKTLVELHGGSIRYAPSPLGGSVFSFALPFIGSP